MKKNLFLYLFILSLLALIFQQVTFKKAKDDKRIQLENERLVTEITAYQDTIAQLNDEALDLMYFTLKHNDYALNYFEEFNLNPEEIIPQIEDAVYDTNFYEEQHPLVPFAATSGGKIVINKIKMLNHRWMVADFNDGPLWGEIFIKYFVNEDKTYSFETVDAFIYPEYK